MDEGIKPAGCGLNYIGECTCTLAQLPLGILYVQCLIFNVFKFVTSHMETGNETKSNFFVVKLLIFLRSRPTPSNA